MAPAVLELLCELLGRHDSKDDLATRVAPWIGRAGKCGQLTSIGTGPPGSSPRGWPHVSARPGKIEGVHASQSRESPSVIDRFTGENHWLNNRSYDQSGYGGHFYPTVEHAYAAAKSADDGDRSEIAGIPAAKEAYELGRQVQLRPEWNTRLRYEAMYTALSAKFKDPGLAGKLEATGDALLIDGVTNHDQHWSDCHCEKHFESPGANHLGRALMAIRASLRDEPADHWPRAAVVGTRELTGDQNRWLAAELPRVLTKLRLEHGTGVLMSGLAMGAGVEVAERAATGGGYEVWAYLPYPDQTAQWPAAWVQRQEAVRLRMSRTVVLGDKPVGANRKRALRLEYDRERLLVRDASVLIAVHDRTAGGQTATIVGLARELGVPVVTMDHVARTVAIAKD